jgi:hypothetical protein
MDREASRDAARAAMLYEAKLDAKLRQRRGLREVWMLMRRTQAVQETQRERAGKERFGRADRPAVRELMGELQRLARLDVPTDSEEWHREVGRVVCDVLAPRIGRENLLDAYVDGPSGLVDQVRAAVGDARVERGAA